MQVFSRVLASELFARQERMADDYLVNYIDQGGGAPDEEHLFEQVCPPAVCLKSTAMTSIACTTLLSLLAIRVSVNTRSQYIFKIHYVTCNTDTQAYASTLEFRAAQFGVSIAPCYRMVE